jgi:flagellar motor protein MotB
MTEPRRAARWLGALALAALSCGPSRTELAQRRAYDELQHELVEQRQYNEDLKFRMRLAEARNKVLIDLVQGLTSDPKHFQAKRDSAANADAALGALDRDVEALVTSVQHSQADLDSLRAQRAALQAELGQARQTIEAAHASQAEQDARLVGLRALLSPLMPLIHSGRLDVRVQYGQLTLQLPESALFATGAVQLSAEGKALLESVVLGLRTDPERKYRIAGPADALAKRAAAPQQLSAARVLAVLDYLRQCQIPDASLLAATGSLAAERGDRYFEITVLPKYREVPTLPGTQELLEGPTAPAPAPAESAPATVAPALQSPPPEQ